MKTLVFNTLDYAQLLRELSGTIGGRMEDSICYPDPAFSEGIYWYLKLENGIQVIFGNNYCKQPFLLYRRGSADEKYVLHFDRLEVTEKLEVKVDTTTITSGTNVYSLAYLTSTLFDWHYLASAGTRIQAVDILLPKHLAAEYLQVDEPDELFDKYLLLRSEKLLEEKMDPLSEEFVRDIIHIDVQHPMWKLTVQNRITLLVENFFSRIHDKLLNWQAETRINRQDVERIRESERVLVGDFNEPAPKISSLASGAAMSPSKYKMLFKTIFGESVYEHYQKRRMARAAEMLSSGKYQVKEVGFELGYSNLSNFTKAFRKVFHLNPSDVIK